MRQINDVLRLKLELRHSHQHIGTTLGAPECASSFVPPDYAKAHQVLQRHPQDKATAESAVQVVER